MNLHHQYAARMTAQPESFMYGHIPNEQWIGEAEDGSLCLVTEEKQAVTRHARRGVARLIDDYLAANWNVTMSVKPEFEIVKVHRPLRIFHPW